MRAKGNFKLSDVTRVEVIDENGRSYTNKDPRNKVELNFQDEGKTLKVYIEKNKDESN